MDENQMHMIFLFMGLLLGKYGTVIWVMQWFMLYHGMIKDKAAIEKAKWARFMIRVFIIGFTLMLIVVLLKN